MHAMKALETVNTGFFAEASEFPDKILEVAFPEIDTPKKLRRYLKNPECYVIGNLRKKRVEVNERRLSAEEKISMNEAKGKEIKEFIKEHVVERITKGEHVDPKDVMKMRWILTWKIDPDTEFGKRGKARLVALGFQDPYLGLETTTSPTLQRRSNQLLLQLATQNDWRLKKGDVTPS